MKYISDFKAGAVWRGSFNDVHLMLLLFLLKAKSQNEEKERREVKSDKYIKEEYIHM